MLRYPTTIATLATSHAIEDLRVLLGTVELFNPNPPTVYLFCDAAVASAGLAYQGKLHFKDALSEYSNYDRRQMEGMDGKTFKTLWMDFMTEKINLLRWALADSGSDVLFCDADICFTGPLPSIPVEATVGLSPHMIRDGDEARYGKYNGGYAWFSSLEDVNVWWNACKDARYYEQSALEDVAKYATEKGGAAALYEFPKTQNYGWWRLWQGKQSSSEILKGWGVNRHAAKGASGICVEGLPLGSVHTHFFDTTDVPTARFNTMIIGWLKMLSSTHPPAKRLFGLVLPRA